MRNLKKKAFNIKIYEISNRYVDKYKERGRDGEKKRESDRKKRRKRKRRKEMREKSERML